MESSHKDHGKKKITEVTTFSVPFNLEVKKNITIHSDIPSSLPKEKIIKQAFKFHSQGNALKAAKYYQLFINKGFKDHRVFSNYGIVLKELGKLKEAELSLRKAIEISPDIADSYCNLGILLRDKGNFNEAEISTRKAIELNPDYAVAHYNLGLILKDMGRLQEAEIYYSKAIEINPDFTNAHLNLGNILRDLGKLQEAEISYNKAIRLNPDYVEAHLNLGNILSDKGKLQEAERSMRKAIKLNPDYAVAHSNLGNILSHQGKLKEAEISTRKATEIEPKSAKFQLNLGVCQFALGNINSSLEKLELAYRLDPNDEIVKSLRKIFKGRNRERTKNFRVKSIIDSLFEEQSNWNPIVLHRVVEEDLIQTLYTLKAQEASNQDRYPRPIYGNIKGSDYDLFESNIPIIKYFQGDLIKILSNYFESEIHIVDSFFNIIKPINGAGGGNKIHNHLNRIDKMPKIDIAKQKFSLVYYLSIGDQNCKDKGVLKFHNPTKDFLPEKGMIVIFPASRFHSVSYNGNKDRIVLVVNFYLV
tara:strand:+ start:2742 stop:4334 length:1593 start_codon:yes stop_codon:yes gene_type:complete